MNQNNNSHNIPIYLEKWITAVLYLLTGGLFGIGILYDFWTLNKQIHEFNLQKPSLES